MPLSATFPLRPALPAVIAPHTTVAQATMAMRGALQPHLDAKVIARDYAYIASVAGPANPSKFSHIPRALGHVARMVLRSMGRTGPHSYEAKITAAIDHIALAFDSMNGQPPDEEVMRALCAHVSLHLKTLLNLERAIGSLLGRWRTTGQERRLLLKKTSAAHRWAERTLRKISALSAKPVARAPLSGAGHSQANELP